MQIRDIIRHGDALEFESLKFILDLPFPRRRFRQASSLAVGRRMREIESFLRNVGSLEPTSPAQISVLREFQLSLCSAEFIASLEKIDTSEEPGRAQMARLPSEKIHELLRSALEIFKSCGEKNLEWRENSALTADDYLPIHIYVVVHSGLRRPLMTKEYLGAMIHPSKMMGEVGYFLTMFEVALKYIADISVARPLRAQAATSHAAQRWLAAMEGAPCLSCGQAAPLAGRVDCSLSGFPLTCSKACAHSLLQSHRGRVEPFRETTIGGFGTKAPCDSCQRHTRCDDAVCVSGCSRAIDYPRSGPGPPARNRCRAEATMPRHIWQELLVQQPDHRFEIQARGDHVPPMRHQQQSRLHLENCPGLYHEVKIEQRPTRSCSSTRESVIRVWHRLWRPTLESAGREWKASAAHVL
ncbi:hypothetical protein PINS_up015657 [Pythium insidiosum]|nr:hypothetical protein PINS_up015657 [Pythium insidiosum]